MKVPTSMMTQHPDSASRYVPIQEEPEEAVLALSSPPEGLGIEEVMIDFEGKLTPYHQTTQIALSLLEKEITPGKDVFITPRIASATQESPFRQLMALMSLMEANVTVIDKGGVPAVREVIIPMCESSNELVEAKRRIVDVIELANKEFGISADPHLVELIPLIEEVPELLRIDEIVGGYLDRLQELGWEVKKTRVMIGRSDPALSYGLVPAVAACKIAVTRLGQLNQDSGVEIAPILGAGSLPFRGHVTPDNLERILCEYRGIRTVTIQSALRYDHGFEKAREVAVQLRKELSSSPPFLTFSPEEIDFLNHLIVCFTLPYLESFAKICDIVVKISDLMPQQRDRLARYTSVGYARDLPYPTRLKNLVKERELQTELEKAAQVFKSVSLPRAITFTASLYTIGFPPEFIGTGRGLKRLKDWGGEEAQKKLLQLYPSFATDLAYAAKFVNLEVTKDFLSNQVFEELKEDLKLLQESLGLVFGPVDEESRFYAALLETSKPILRQLTDGVPNLPHREEASAIVQDWIKRQGKIRGSLG